MCLSWIGASHKILFNKANEHNKSLFYTQYKMDEDTKRTSHALIWSNVRDKTLVNFGQEDAYRLETFIWHQGTLLIFCLR